MRNPNSKYAKFTEEEERFLCMVESGLVLSYPLPPKPRTPGFDEAYVDLISRKCVIRKRYMTLNEYQDKARETAKYPAELGVTYTTLGLTGEAGEVADKVKKIIRDNGGVLTDEKRLEIAKEVGDVLWYIAMLSAELGYTLDDIAWMNYEKLHSRAERGKIGGSGDNR